MLDVDGAVPYGGNNVGHVAVGWYAPFVFGTSRLATGGRWRRPLPRELRGTAGVSLDAAAFVFSFFLGGLLRIRHSSIAALADLKVGLLRPPESVPRGDTPLDSPLPSSSPWRRFRGRRRDLSSLLRNLPQIESHTKSVGRWRGLLDVGVRGVCFRDVDGAVPYQCKNGVPLG